VNAWFFEIGEPARGRTVRSPVWSAELKSIELGGILALARFDKYEGETTESQGEKRK
jgi:hypothetical protein